MGLNDDLAADIIGGAISLQSAFADTESEVLRVLLELQQELTTLLLDGPELSESGRRSINNLIKASNLTIKEKMRLVREISEADLAEFAELSSLEFIESIQDNVPGWAPNYLSATQLQSIVAQNAIQGTPAKEWWLRQELSTQRAFRNVIDQGVLQGKTMQQIVSAVHGTKAEAFKDGMMLGTKRETIALVRTAVISVTSKAQVKTYEKNDDIIKKLRHQSTLDSRVTPICVARSGLLYKRVDGEWVPDGHDKPFLDGVPYHYQCRSVLTPVTRSWAELSNSKDPRVIAKLKAFKPDPGTQASMDGQVPAELTLQDFAERKGDEYLNKRIGKGKAQMIRDGKINAKDLIDQNGEIRNLVQLRALKSG